MANWSEMSLSVRNFMRFYRYWSVDWRPGAFLQKPLNETRLSLITTAALYLPEQDPFEDTHKKGDCTYRIIPKNFDLKKAKISHTSTSFDPTGMESDRNLVLPLNRLHEMVDRGELGSVAENHYSFSGSILRPKPLIEDTAPALAEELIKDNIDAVFLTPV